MIARLTGNIYSKQPPALVVDVHGVGYELEVPMSTFFDLPEVGATVSLFTHYAIRDDSAALYGFLRDSEREMFRTLQRVSGIGARIALAVLSAVPVADFARQIQAADIPALTRIPGIGKKTAERMIVELRDRMEPFAGAAGSAQAAPAEVPRDPVSEATEAMQSLGYRAAEAGRLVKAAAAEGDSAEEIIRKALQAAVR